MFGKTVFAGRLSKARGTRLREADAENARLGGDGIESASVAMDAFGQGPGQIAVLAMAIVAMAALPLLLSASADGRSVLVGSYPSFHLAAELVAIVTATLIFNVGHYGMARERPAAGYILAVTFLAVALLDVLHTLSYSGMPDFITSNTSRKATVFWLGARYIEAGGLLLWILWPDRWADRPRRPVLLAAALGWVAMVAVAAFAYGDALPAANAIDSGLTPLEVVLERGVIALLAVAAVAAIRRRQHRADWQALVAILLLMIASELCFTVYGQLQETTGALGQIYKLAALFLLYRIAVVQGIHHPIRALAAARGRLIEREANLRQILDGAPEAVLGVDAEGVVRFVNRMVVVLFGYEPAAIVGYPVEVLVPERMRNVHRVYRERYRRLPKPRVMQLRNDLTGCRADGSEFPIEVSLQPADDADGLDVVFIRDVTDKRRQEEELRWRANYDELTALPNRRLLNDRLGHALAGSRRSRNFGALLFLDLDNFKNLNDTRGHYVGDRLLVETSHRIQACVRGGDTVARLGGDEFVVILEDLSGDLQEAAVQARHVGEKIRGALGEPYQLDGGEFHCAASLGIAMFRGDEETVESLLKHADLAMYKAKSAGRNTLRFFDPAMQVALDERSGLEADLRLALESDQLHLQYQPQVDRRGQYIGAEALLRWTHPVRGLVPPDDFIPMAEETGLILPIGHWVLMTACIQIAAWERIPATRGLRLAVNVSARQFHQPDFVADVRQVLTRTGADPGRLKIELTESMVLEDIGETFEKMHALKSMGVGFSLDDFGTGSSSLSYLTRLPLDQLKIDRSFVLNLPGNRNDAIIAQTIITMARSLGLDVIAEGVETEAQRDFLDRHDCTAYQGYLFSRPLSLSDFNQLLSGTAFVGNA